VEVSRRTLKILAAVVWYAGGAALMRKGVSLLLESRRQDPESDCLFVAIGAALLLGGLKARFLFNRSCRRNLARIAALEHPRIWQFFRPGFFVALAVMIATGALLSRLAHADPRYICFVAAVDLTIAVALLGSSWVFWRERAFAAPSRAG
jgi:hypothetical protein